MRRVRTLSDAFTRARCDSRRESWQAPAPAAMSGKNAHLDERWDALCMVAAAMPISVVKHNSADLSPFFTGLSYVSLVKEDPAMDFGDGPAMPPNKATSDTSTGTSVPVHSRNCLLSASTI